MMLLRVCFTVCLTMEKFPKNTIVLQNWYSTVCCNKRKNIKYVLVELLTAVL